MKSKVKTHPMRMLGWLLIPTWVVYVATDSYSDLMSSITQSLGVETRTLVYYLFLLLPIALLSLVLVYRMDLHHFMIDNRPDRPISRVSRSIFAVTVTLAVLFASWLLFIILTAWVLNK